MKRIKTEMYSNSWSSIKSDHANSDRVNMLANSDVLPAVTKNKIDTLNVVIAENDQVNQELNICKIIEYALKNVIRKGIPGNPSLTEKLKLVVGAEEVGALCQNIPLLGLEMENFTVCLSPTERNEIKPFLENEIIKECQKILQYDDTEGCDRVNSAQQAGVNVIPIEISQTIKERMNCKLHKWNELLLNLKSLISDLLDLRQEVKLLREKENSLLSVSCESLELEAKILALQIQMHMYSENSYVVPATKKATLSAEEEYSNTIQELEDLKKRKEAYDSLKGTEFDEVLQEYIQLKKDIDIKSWALNKLQRE